MRTSTPIIPFDSPLRRYGANEHRRRLVAVGAVVAGHLLLFVGLLIKGAHFEVTGPGGSTVLSAGPEIQPPRVDIRGWDKRPETKPAALRGPAYPALAAERTR